MHFTKVNNATKKEPSTIPNINPANTEPAIAINPDIEKIIAKTCIIVLNIFVPRV